MLLMNGYLRKAQHDENNLNIEVTVEVISDFKVKKASVFNGFKRQTTKSTASKPPVVRLSSASADFTQASKCRPTGRHFVCASCMQNKNAGPPKQTCVLLGKRGGKQHTGGNLVCVYPHTLWNNFTPREVKLMNLM
ncbi:hypothetical protein [Intestinimonas butyriciproducens]|uniref:hypothetical protein n=1 Tax=Intestinimonas butyriciproducens TaxID=1297617 RepID=UPI0018CDC042|nr:hypothetical protein [Intestinimonas butyriciproducens]